MLRWLLDLLSGDRVKEVTLLDAKTVGDLDHGCAITVWSPRTNRGHEALTPSIVLAAPPFLNARRLVTRKERRPFRRRQGHTCARLAFPTGTSFYGTGEVAGPLLRNGRSTELWNTDAWEYDDSTVSLYQSHPWVLAVLPDGSAVGLLADTARRGRIEIGDAHVEFRFEGDPFHLYRIEGPDPQSVQRALVSMIGRIALPPIWALGYHQCRWSYLTADEMREIARGFDDRKIPCDAVWFDIDYLDRHRVFTWDEKAFPDPRGLIDELHERNLHAVAIVDPGIAVAPGYGIYEGGRAGGHFVVDGEGRPAEGKVWPGVCRFPDFTAPRTRAWWAGHVRDFLRRYPLDGVWNDMNEPAVFEVETKTLPETVRHAGIEPLGPGSHAQYHNLYGQCMASATHAGVRAARPDRRPFVLTRANHLSGARFSATWTGDNQSKWEHLRWSISMVLNLGLSGQPFSGSDVGGFFGDPSEELFVRWFDLASLLPFFRGHSEKESCRKEPWSFGEEAEAHVRRAIERRMRLLPTIYTLFREATESGLPVVRPLFFSDPHDTSLRAVDDAFLLGRDLLVAPVVDQGATERHVRFPIHPGGWYPFPAGGARITDREITVPAPLGTLPLFARAGSILFETNLRSRAHTGGDLHVHAFLDADGRAEGRLYEDEGEGYAFEADRFLDRHFAFEQSRLTAHMRGDWIPPARARTLHVHDQSGANRGERRPLGERHP